MKESIVRTFRDDEWIIRGNSEHPDHDAHGFRNPVSVGNDIFIVGDSWAYGMNLKKSESWPILLSQSFGVRCAAVSGWGMFQYYMAVRELMPLATKICVVCLYLGNDIVGSFVNVKSTKSKYRNLFWKDHYDKFVTTRIWTTRRRREQLAAIEAEHSVSKLEAFELAHSTEDIDLRVLHVDGKQFVFRPRLRAELTDLSSPHINAGLEMTKTMISEIVNFCDENGIEPFFMICFSKEACFAHSGLTQDVELSRVLQNELNIYNNIESHLEEHYVKRHCFLNNFSDSPDTLFFSNTLDGHPNSAGSWMIYNTLRNRLHPLLQDIDVNNYPFA